MRSLYLIAFGFVLLSLLLSSCEEMQLGQGGADPYAAIAGADATQSAAKAQLQATEQAVRERSSQATLQAARTQGAAQIEIDLLRARAQSTQEAFDLQIASDKATQEAGYARQTVQAALAVETQQAARQTQEAVPTTTAIADIVRHEENMRDQAQVRDMLLLWFWPLLMVAVIVAVVILAVRLGLDTYREWIKWQSLRNSVRGPEGGRFVMAVKDQLPQFVGSTRPLPLARPDPVRPLGPGEIAFASPMPEHKPARTATHLVIQLLEDAIAIAGETSTVLPGWRDFQDAGFDWDSARWQQAVKPIAQAGGLIPRVSLGTAVAEDYQDLAGLLEAIELRKLRVPALAEEPVG